MSRGGGQMSGYNVGSWRACVPRGRVACIGVITDYHHRPVLAGAVGTVIIYRSLPARHQRCQRQPARNVTD